MLMVLSIYSAGSDNQGPNAWLLPDHSSNSLPTFLEQTLTISHYSMHIGSHIGTTWTNSLWSVVFACRVFFSEAVIHVPQHWILSTPNLHVFNGASLDSCISHVWPKSIKCNCILLQSGKICLHTNFVSFHRKTYTVDSWQIYLVSLTVTLLSNISHT